MAARGSRSVLVRSTKTPSNLASCSALAGSMAKWPWPSVFRKRRKPVLPTSALSPPGQLTLETGENGLARGGVLFGLLMVAAQDVACVAHGHRLGLVVDLVATLGDRQRHARCRVGEDDITHPAVGALTGAEEIEELARLELSDGLGSDHAAVGDHTDPADREAPAQPVDHRDQRGDVGDIARPDLGAHRPPVAIDQDRQDHLAEVRAMILAVAVAAEGLAARAFEVETGGVHEYQIEPAEEIAPVGEQPLL